MKIALKILILFSSLIFIISCQKDKIQSIPSSVEKYVNSFFDDAKQNGLNISLNNYDLFIEFSDLDVNGSCYKRRNTIELDSIHWLNASDIERKWLIYHELGHCILDREHNNLCFPNGECKSIMREGNDIPTCSVNLLSKSWIKYYIKELFTEKDDLPSWYKIDTKTKNLDSSNCYNIMKFDTTINENEDMILSNIMLDTDSDFQIYFKFNNWQTKFGQLEIYLDKAKIFLIAKNKEVLIRNKFSQGKIFSYVDYYYKGIFLGSEENTSICILKNAGYYYFYVNNRLVHIMDFDGVKINEISTSFFERKTHVEIEIFNFL